MKLSLRINTGYRLVELTVENQSTTITEDISNFEGLVNLEFISNLKHIINMLESNNEYIIRKLDESKSQ